MKSPLDLLSVIPPVPTPLLRDGSVDTNAFSRIAAHLENGGIDAAFLLGSTGELASLGHRQRRTVITASCEAFSVPVIVGIGDTCLEETLSLAHAAADSGAAAVVLNAPAYFEIDTKEMCAYLNLVLPQLPLPVYLYNMPWLTGYHFDRETVRCCLRHEGVVGIKDSSGKMDCLRMLVEESSIRPEVRIFVGNEFLFLDGLKAGAHGVVGGGGNLYPSLFRELMNAYLSGDMATAVERQAQITRLGELLFGLNGNPCSGFATIKAGLSAIGLCESYMAPPIQTCSPEVRDLIGSILRPSAAA